MCLWVCIKTELFTDIFHCRDRDRQTDRDRDRQTGRGREIRVIKVTM